MLIFFFRYLCIGIELLVTLSMLGSLVMVEIRCHDILVNINFSRPTYICCSGHGSMTFYVSLLSALAYIWEDGKCLNIKCFLLELGEGIWHTLESL